MTKKAHLKIEEKYTLDRSWFIVYLVAFVFGVVWTLLGESDFKIIYITVAFTCFLRAGINMEMSARALHEDDAH
ncbi:MAG: hypothetical protein U9Q62_01640 [Campylobacterota bacterium]|nr:hypothetical protein [Campylobacterota bacterium]